MRLINSSSSASSSSCCQPQHCTARVPRAATRAATASASTSYRLHPRSCVVAAAAAAGDSSIDEVLESIRDAFAAPPSPRSRAAADPTPRAPAAAQGGAGAAAVRPVSSSRKGNSSSSRSSSSSGSSSVGKRGTMKGTKAKAAAAGPAAAAAPRKRRNRFSDLMDAIEHDLLYPEEAPTAGSSSNSSTSSSGTSSATAKALQTSSSSSGSRRPVAVAAAAAPTGRSTVRRLRSNTPGNTQQQDQQQQQQQQQQRQPQQCASLPAPHSTQQPQQQQPQQQQQELPPWLQQQQAEAAASGPGRRVKQYAPVSKGDLLLPGGPAWSSLRRHLVAAGGDPSLPTLSCIVIVEGDNDQRAVARAVNAPVYVCDGTRALKEHVRPELHMLGQLGRQLVVLTDPDERGRELRVHLDDIMGPLLHAFVPEQQGTSTEDGATHAAGNRGIEHVVPLGVQQALSAAQPSWPRSRAAWSAEDLQALQLANAFDAGHEGVVRGPGGAAARRRQLCALLGLGRCTAAQLLGALNRFFTEEQLQAALETLDAQLPRSNTAAV